MNLNILAIPLGIAGLVVVGPVAAQEARSEQVQVNDLDLRFDAGVQRLDRRIRTAVAHVCGGAPALPLSEQSMLRQCHDLTMANVQPVRDRVVSYARERQGQVDVVMLTVKRAPLSE